MIVPAPPTCRSSPFCGWPPAFLPGIHAFALLLLLLPAGTAPAATIYEASEEPLKVVGAWDVNILADDVHFETPAVIRQVRLRLAIKGNQACQLWIFAALDSPPIYTAAFTNVPATNEYNVSTYDFDMQLQVPRDIYVGFSAQGDGWSALNLSDYWTRSFSVNRGVAGTAGEYYYGLVADGQLTAVYNSEDATYACLQILSEPVQIGGLGLAGGQVHLAIDHLPVYAANTVERNESADGINWLEVETLPSGASNHVWISTNAAAPRAFYRVATR